MKIYLSSLRLFTFKLLALKLIKNGILCNKRIVEVLKNFKTILKFFLSNKKILLLGIPKKITYFFNTLNKFKKITYIPEHVWLQGLLTNSFVFKSFKFSTKKRTFNFLFNFLPDYDLILNFSSLKNKEIYKSGRPVINLSEPLRKKNQCIFRQKLIFNFKTFYFVFIYQVLLKFKNVN